MTAEQTLISQGAEAKLYKVDFYGYPAVSKVRFSKKYRHKLLDEKIIHNQMTQELRLIHRCKLASINVPAIYHVDKVNNTIYYEYISDLNAKRYLDDNLSNKEIESELAAKAAETLAKLHDLGVVHGDLTTSNMLLVHKNNETPRDMELYLIDFGLGFVSSLPEDKAVDLYVFERALASTYPNCEQFLEKFYDSYTRLSKHSKTTLRRLADVRLRGRKRDMTG